MKGFCCLPRALYVVPELNTQVNIEKSHVLEELTTGDRFHNMKNIHQYFVFVH